MSSAVQVPDAKSAATGTLFFTLVRNLEDEAHARLLIESLRVFGGRFRSCPVWVIRPDTAEFTGSFPGLGEIRLVPLEMGKVPRYFFASKVFACARAEETAPPEIRSLVWMNPQCLIVNPPAGFDLGPKVDAAFRVVHIRNIGSLASEPLDAYWEGVYEAVGIEDLPQSLESFVDQQQIRPYFNSHLFSIDPSKGVLQSWKELFKRMVSDQEFQSGPCADVDHQIFLHQAILSALLAKSLDWERIRLLPPEYSYPLHFHSQVPEDLRPETLNSQVCPVYEETFQYPDTLNGIEVGEPLRTWLASRAGPSGTALGPEPD